VRLPVCVYKSTNPVSRELLSVFTDLRRKLWQTMKQRKTISTLKQTHEKMCRRTVLSLSVLQRLSLGFSLQVVLTTTVLKKEDRTISMVA